MDLSFGVNKVIKNLKTGQISSTRQLLFLILGSWLGYAIINAVGFVWKDAGSYNTLNSAIAWAICIVLSLAFLNLYRINRNRDNKDFILRFITLHSAIGWRLVLIFLPVATLAYYYLSNIPLGSFRYTADLLMRIYFFKPLAALIFLVIYFPLMSLSFTKVAGKKRA